MPFDPLDYVPPQVPPPRREPPRLSPAGERIIMVLVAGLVLMLFVLPFSAATFIDILRYVGD